MARYIIIVSALALLIPSPVALLIPSRLIVFVGSDYGTLREGGPKEKSSAFRPFFLDQMNQRVSMSERAAEAVRKRVDGLAEEVANLGEIVRKSNASTATALEQLLADEQRSR